MSAPARTPRRMAIERAADAIMAGAPIAPADAAYVGQALKRICAGDDPAVAFDLRRKPGEHAVETVRARELRDELLRQAAVQYASGMLSNRARAAWLRAELHTYETRGGWLNDRLQAECPARLRGVRAMCWAILKALPRVPGEKTIIRALDKCSADLMSRESP